jgi:succinylarginine dihydrolase
VIKDSINPSPRPSPKGRGGKTHEINFDGIVGPTHNYAGLSYGNIASMTNKSSVSSPREAALQGLAKMKFLHDLGVKQAVVPPHERPHLPTLRRIGFSGTDAEVLAKAQKESNGIFLAAVSSSSAMWTANAATVSPSSDTADHRVHLTPANLITQFHRSIEAETTSRILRAIFSDDRHFAHHDPLLCSIPFADEGAANHMRLTSARGDEDAGIEIFVYGYEGFQPAGTTRCKFPERQTLEACRAIARMHRLDPERTLFVRQNPRAIDAGAFHNDVVAVSRRNMLLAHELAFASAEDWEAIRRASPGLSIARISEAELSLDDAVSSYLFNSQIVITGDGAIALIAPTEARENPRAHAVILRILTDGPVDSVHFVDVRQSMRNGGGPACLRLRVTLTDQEIAATNPRIFLTDELYTWLQDWVRRHYRESLDTVSLSDPKLLDEGRAALDELSQKLGLGSIYSFQQ